MFSRQRDIWENCSHTVTIVGCGTLGSYAALLLVKVGFTDIALYDPDVVEDVNVPLQLYGRRHVGMAKVGALKEIITQLAPLDVNISTFPSRFSASNWRPTKIVVSCPDNMQARRDVYNAVASVPGRRLLVDVRSGDLAGGVYALRTDCPKCLEAYEKYLYDDDQAAPIPCTARGIAYSSAAISSIAISLVRSFVMNKEMHAVEVLVYDCEQISRTNIHQ